MELSDRWERNKDLSDGRPLARATFNPDCGEYADLELFLAPTYDFVMKLLQVGAWVEVIEPLHLRGTMKAWIKDMYDAYKED